MDEPVRRSILILGKLCSDNTTAVNALLGAEMYAENYQFRHYEEKLGEINAVPVIITITSGIMELSMRGKNNQLRKDIRKIYQEKKFELIIVTSSYPFRWTDEERAMRDATLQIVGEKDLSEKGVLLVVNALDIKRKPGGPISYFDEYIQRESQQIGENAIGSFLKYFKQGYRYICLDCDTGDEAINLPQIEKFTTILLSCIENVPESMEFTIIEHGLEVRDPKKKHVGKDCEQISQPPIGRLPQEASPSQSRSSADHLDTVDQFLAYIKTRMMLIQETDWSIFSLECQKLIESYVQPARKQQKRHQAMANQQAIEDTN